MEQIIDLTVLKMNYFILLITLSYYMYLHDNTINNEINK